LQEVIVVSRILGAFAPNIPSFNTTGYFTPLTPLIPHCVNHIVSLHGKCNKESAPKITSFYTTMKKCNENFAPKITSFYTTMKKYNKNFAPKIMSFYTIMKKMQ
jgi:hypothetical protein